MKKLLNWLMAFVFVLAVIWLGATLADHRLNGSKASPALTAATGYTISGEQRERVKDAPEATTMRFVRVGDAVGWREDQTYFKDGLAFKAVTMICKDGIGSKYLQTPERKVLTTGMPCRALPPTHSGGNGAVLGRTVIERAYQFDKGGVTVRATEQRDAETDALLSETTDAEGYQGKLLAVSFNYQPFDHGLLEVKTDVGWTVQQWAAK